MIARVSLTTKEDIGPLERKKVEIQTVSPVMFWENVRKQAKMS